MNTKVSYKLIATLVTQKNGVAEKNVYEHTIRVRFLKRIGEKATFYNKELNMYFEDKSALSVVFELEIDKVRLFLSRQLEQATEFIKATHYRYDWMQVKVKLSGKPVSINNKEELKQRWKKLNQRLRKDYKGGVVDTYLNALNKTFENDQHLWNAVSQYFYFGLVFPQIPMKHKSGWSQKRMVEFSDYEEEFFEEQITHSATEENIENYVICGNALPGSSTTLLKYEGSISKKKMNLLPERAIVDIELQKEYIFSQWHFNLQRVSL